MNISKIEKNILDFIYKKLDIIFFFVMTFLALYLRYFLRSFKTDDFIYFLDSWMNKIISFGGIDSLGHVIGDYNVPYMFILSILSYLPFNHLILIKIVSVIFDVVLALSASLIVGEILKKNRNVKTYQIITYLIILFLPAVFFDSAYWGQCDSIYSSFCILAIYFLLKNKYTLSFVMLGVAFAFKLQAIFLLPAYFIIYLSKRNFSIVYFLIIPIINFVLCLPAILMGRGITETLSIYFNQTSTWKILTLGVPNIYQFIDGPYCIMSKLGIILTIVLFGFLLYFILKHKIDWSQEKIIVLIILSILICVMFLPAMHDRYLYVADVISVVWYICYRKKIYIPILLNLMTVIMYMNYLSAGIDPIIMQFMTVVFMILLFDLCKYFCNICLEDKKKGVFL